MGLHSSFTKTCLMPIGLTTKMEITAILLHLHSLGIITLLQFSKLPYLKELENSLEQLNKHTLD
jgi:hypothetical protein